MIGKTISHYEIIKKLGEGGMGVVYKAEDTKLKRTVALKFLPQKLTSNEDAKHRFIREARAAASLDHHNISTVYEINETEDGQTFIAMSYYEGETLRQKIDQGPLKLEEAIDIALQVADGLKIAHKKNIFHRDIKPANIMFTKEGTVKIIDFGLAMLQGETRLTKEMTTMGTAFYMSPEQAGGEEVDHRTDIWSLAVLLYEMVTGELPFKGDHPLVVINNIINNDPEPLKSIRNDIPEDLEQIINKALSKDISKRYQQVDHLMMDLDRLKKDTVSGPVTPGDHITRGPLKRHLLPVIFALVMAIILVFYLIFNTGEKKESPVIKSIEKPSLAIIYFENKSGDEKLDNWREAFSQLLTTDLSQSKYLQVLRSDQVYSIFRKLNLLEAKRYSEEDIQKIAKNGRVNHVLTGSYIKAGENFAITAILINASTGETITSLSVKARGEENIFNKIDDLTKEIKQKLDLNPEFIADDFDHEVKDITTNSPDAYKHYIAGVRYHSKIDYLKAVESLKKAIAIDPGFALAYRKAFASYSNLGYDVAAREYLQKAYNLRHRVSERERLLIEETYFRESENTFPKARKALEELLRLYPNDLLGRYNLAYLYEAVENWEQAIPPLKVCIEQGDTFWGVYQTLSSIYYDMGKKKEAMAIIDDSFNTHANPAVIRNYKASHYLLDGKYDLALQEINQCYSLSPDQVFYWNSGDVYLLKEEFKKAFTEYNSLIKYESSAALYFYILGHSNLNSIQGKFVSQKGILEYGRQVAESLKGRRAERIARYRLAKIHRRMGDHQTALEHCNKIIEGAKSDQKLEQLRTGLLQKGLTLVEMGRLEEAEHISEELKSLIKKGIYPKSIRYYHHLAGHITLAKKQYTKAEEHFNLALSALPEHWPFHTAVCYGLGQTYLKKGDLVNARQTFEAITKSKTKGLGLRPTDIWYGISHCDLYSLSHYYLGKICLKTKNKKMAKNSFETFIKLWRDCDKNYQHMVGNAKKEIEGLKDN